MIPLTRQLLYDRFAIHGIPCQRLLILSTNDTEEWYATFARVDIVLDPFPRTGTTTTAEALWMGLPVITLAGQRYVDRASADVLTAIGMEGLITYTHEEYLGLAMALARDPEHRARLRASLRERMINSPLCDANGLARAMESAYEEMWERIL